MNEAIHQEDEILGKAYDARLMARILRYLRPYWRLLALSLTFLLLHTGTQLLGDLGADIIKIERPGEGDDTRK